MEFIIKYTNVFWLIAIVTIAFGTVFEFKSFRKSKNRNQLLMAGVGLFTILMISIGLFIDVFLI